MERCISLRTDARVNNRKTSNQVNQATFDLWTCGPNRVNEHGEGDDRTNWRR